MVVSQFEIPTWAHAVTVSLLKILRYNEPGIYEHSLRVADHSKQLASFLGLNTYQQRVAEIAGLLHDLGEITIDQDILAKPTKLNVVEYELMKSHVLASVEFIQPLSAIHPFFKAVEEAILYHHENETGSGYPNHVESGQIPLLSKIMNITDAFDSMTTSRVYKKALTVDLAYEEIRRSLGTQFNTQVGNAFLASHRFFTKHTTEDLESSLFNKVA